MILVLIGRLARMDGDLRKRSGRNLRRNIATSLRRLMRRERDSDLRSLTSEVTIAMRMLLTTISYIKTYDYPID